MHVHVSVANLPASIRFYSELFAAEPTIRKSDYAKWMLESPRVNFAISNRGAETGVRHLGIQVEDRAELTEVLTERAPTTERKSRPCLGTRRAASLRLRCLRHPNAVPDMPTLRTATRQDAAAIRTLLELNSLPASDLTTAQPEFIVARGSLCWERVLCKVLRRPRYCDPWWPAQSIGFRRRSLDRAGTGATRV